jgi:hypothetical protein
MMTTWRGKRKMKIGTWNVRSIAGKEIELVGEIKELNVEQVSIVMAGRGINWREARIVAQDRSR